MPFLSPSASLPGWMSWARRLGRRVLGCRLLVLLAFSHKTAFHLPAKTKTPPIKILGRRTGCLHWQGNTEVLGLPTPTSAGITQCKSSVVEENWMGLFNSRSYWVAQMCMDFWQPEHLWKHQLRQQQCFGFILCNAGEGSCDQLPLVLPSRHHSKSLPTEGEGRYSAANQRLWNLGGVGGELGGGKAWHCLR